MSTPLLTPHDAQSQFVANAYADDAQAAIRLVSFISEQYEFGLQPEYASAELQLWWELRSVSLGDVAKLYGNL